MSWPELEGWATDLPSGFIKTARDMLGVVIGSEADCPAELVSAFLEYSHTVQF